MFAYLEHPDLADHGLGVDLTHVVARVIPLHVPDVELPRVDPIVGDGHPGVVGHHVVVDGQDGLAVRSQPCNLHSTDSTHQYIHEVSVTDSGTQAEKIQIRTILILYSTNSVLI